ncbi:MAG: oxidoreductase [Chitinophagales bacterium]|nr:MAG: oxidoreductase [Chitinophagales bacterium]
MDALRIGVLGAGYLGKIHLRLISKLSCYTPMGFYDPHDANALLAEQETGIPRFYDREALLDAVDVVDVVTPTSSHYESAAAAIQKGKHVFIEKPLAEHLQEARQLMQMAEQAGIKAMVGHVERFNPAFLAIQGMQLQPMFIETHRLAAFHPRGTDVPVVLDLMVHDIDLILSMVHSDIRDISASGVAVISSTPDVANARIEFTNGCVANITCSRISMKKMRRIRLFQKDTYISMDLLDKSTEVFRLNAHNDAENAIVIETRDGEAKKISYEKITMPEMNAIQTELELFARSILTDQPPPVSLLDGYRALEVAYRVLETIEKNQAAVQYPANPAH